MPAPTFARFFRALCFFLIAASGLGPAAAQNVPAALSSGQVLYLPIYSHIYHGDNERDGKPLQTLMSAHVSIRNTDPGITLKIHYARYYNTEGRLVKEYISGSPVSIPPFGTHELFVPRGDTTGGSGANFMIAWSADAPANPPLVEALHSNVQPARSVAFLTTARPIHAPAR